MHDRLDANAQALETPTTFSPRMREQLRAISKPFVPPPPVKEEAYLVPNECHLVVSGKPLSEDWSVSYKNITAEFKSNKGIRGDERLVIVTGAKDVRLYSSVGLQFTGRSHTDFVIDRAPTLTTLVHPYGPVHFRYGDTLFCFDQRNLVAKVWSRRIGYDLVKGGYLYFCEVEPRPEISFRKTRWILREL